MKHLSIIVLAVSLALLGSAGGLWAQEGGYAVVGHPATTPDSVSQKELTQVFLKQRKSWSTGQQATPVDQATNSEVRQRFSEGALGKSIREVDGYWQGQVFAGKGSPPQSFRSDQEVVDFVRRTPGAVGYVSASASADGVKLLRVTK